MSLQQILHHLQEAEREIVKIANQEQDAQPNGEKILYTFIYDQHKNNTWEPRYQYVYGHDIAEAFSSFGKYIKLRDIVVRNVCYGTIDDMQEKANIIANYHWPVNREVKEQ